MSGQQTRKKIEKMLPKWISLLPLILHPAFEPRTVQFIEDSCCNNYFQSKPAGLTAKYIQFFNEGIALPLNNGLERVNLHEKYDYPYIRVAFLPTDC